ncbi:kelch repeat and BTB domain-containing protein 2-like isoform X2 [Gigantopelta aegis]|uniref:kelch repeat and BTB domain-containing protein 2-like isoform X2 n=1 Tax=Gigantopelta aegis TaxID=1735272 RepID=UPI001B88AAD0|nr:kelch repeat and BTB domain-containing protein 2-like isoform X2 [Gigantopelta aegis]
MPDSSMLAENYNYIRRLTQGLTTALEHRLFTDVVIKVDQVEFPCHKVVLCSMSPYFEGMFSSGMKESSQSVIQLHDLNSEWFELVLTYMYSGHIHLTNNNVKDILHIGSFLQVLCLQELCEEYILEEMLTLDNCLSLWQLAPTYGCGYLQHQAKSFIIRHFKLLVENGELQQLSQEELKDILSDEHLIVRNEAWVLEVAINWMKMTKTEPSKAKDVFESVRLDLIPSSEWESLLEKVIVTADKGLCSMLNALRTTMLASDEYNVQNRVRFFDRLQNIIVAYPSREITDQDDDSDTEVIQFPYCVSLDQKKSMKLPHCPFDLPKIESICFHGHNLYLAGVTRNGVALARFDGSTGVWHSCKKLCQIRTKFTLVSCESHVYLIGGVNENLLRTWITVEQYDPETDEWCKKGDLVCPVTEFSFVTSGDTIFTYLGICRRTVYTDSNTVRMTSECIPEIQSFNCTTGQCEVIGRLPGIISNGPGNRHSFAFRRDTTVFVITPRGMVIKVPDFGRDPVFAGDIGELSPVDSRFHGIDTGSKVYLIGSRYSLPISPDVFLFDYDAMVVTKVEDLAFCSCVSACAFGRVKKRFLLENSQYRNEPDDAGVISLC